MFGNSLLRAGHGAIFTKLDMRDAFKLVPAKPADYRLQGFGWLGSFFVDTQQIFGAVPSVSNFDRLAETVLDIATTVAEVPANCIHRTLDDVVCVARPETGICQRFTEAYKAVCNNLNIPLATPCPKREKAFENETEGTVLGVMFDSKTLTWRFSDEKIAKILDDIFLMSTMKHADLKQTEKLVGRLNNFGQMMPMMRVFRRPMNMFLASFKEDYNILHEIPADLVEDLKIWHNVISKSYNWSPVAEEIENPPVDALYFTSDAAGGTGKEEWAGVASVGHYDEKSIWYVCTGAWPEAIFSDTDEKGVAFASKMTTLELIGLFLPLLTVPDRVRGRSVVLGVDNISVVFAWENGSVRGDLHASCLVRALYIVSIYLECRVFVHHIPRLSTMSSYMADSLTRKSTAASVSWAATVGVTHLGCPSSLWDWLRRPSVDWNLGLKLINDL
jgi:hypothetical protein